MPKAPRAETLAEETLAPADFGAPIDAPPPPAAAASTRTQFTPAELAKMTGNATEVKSGIRMGGGSPEPQTVFSWQHAAAAQLHGWGLHEHHAGQAIELSLDDYKAALLAAAEPVTRLVNADGSPGEPLTPDAVAKLNGRKPTASHYEPHKGALSPHAPKEG
jgi:hypothetical protein